MRIHLLTKHYFGVRIPATGTHWCAPPVGWVETTVFVLGYFVRCNAGVGMSVHSIKAPRSRPLTRYLHYSCVDVDTDGNADDETKLRLRLRMMLMLRLSLRLSGG